MTLHSQWLTIVGLMRRIHVVVPVLLAVVATACGSDSPSAGGSAGGAEPSGSVVVFAASSLTEAFTELGQAFTAAHPKAKVTFNFAGSADLVAQIGQGAPADVFASADDTNMTKLVAAGENVGDAVTIAKNTMEILVEKGNPRKITSVSDLANADLVVVLCAPAVPCGKSAAAVLHNAG